MRLKLKIWMKVFFLLAWNPSFSFSTFEWYDSLSALHVQINSASDNHIIPFVISLSDNLFGWYSITSILCFIPHCKNAEQHKRFLISHAKRTQDDVMIDNFYNLRHYICFSITLTFVHVIYFGVGCSYFIRHNQWSIHPYQYLIQTTNFIWIHKK